ncbi:MAG: PDDEXK nuclease domain-containing protein [Planctomycetota bacterium]
MSKNLSATPEGYGDLLTELKARIRSARVKAALAVNSELVFLYWGIGNEILARQHRQGWGTKVVERLASDLSETFPEMKGLSPRNLLFMRSLAQAWPEEAIVKQLVSQLPWGHNIRLIQKVKDPAQRQWYARSCVEHGWSRNVLEMQIESGLFERQGAAGSNFNRTLPAPQSDLAQETLKDPYSFEFLSTTDLAHERAIERGLVANIRDFLLELGEGFAFVGNQVKLEVGGEDFYIDLLFYHLRLRAYVVIELKAGAFKPEYAGKLNFYVSAADDLLRHPDDNQTIGILLCRGKNRVVAEYALRGTTQPMGVSEFTLTDAQLEQLDKKLPTVEQLELDLNGE